MAQSRGHLCILFGAVQDLLSDEMTGGLQVRRELDPVAEVSAPWSPRRH